MIRLLLLLMTLGGCAGVPKPAPIVPETKRAEMRPLPPDPAVEALPEGLAPGEWAVPVEAGQCDPPAVEGPCPERSGILISERKAARLKLYSVRYVELRKTYESDRVAWGGDRLLYEAKLKLASDKIVELQPTWWDENAGTLGFSAGVLVGGIIAVVIANAMADAVPNTVNVGGM